MKQFSTVLLMLLFLMSSVSCNNARPTEEIIPSAGTIEPVVNKKMLPANNYRSSVFQEQNSKEQVMGWLIINYLSPYIKKSLKNNYGGNVPYCLTDPASDILEANFAEDKSYFIVKLQVEPYLGAHNTIGLDNFTFKINLSDNKVTLEKYEHIKSFKVPDHVKKQHSDLNL